VGRPPLPASRVNPRADLPPPPPPHRPELGRRLDMAVAPPPSPPEYEGRPIVRPTPTPPKTRCFTQASNPPP